LSFFELGTKKLRQLGSVTVDLNTFSSGRIYTAALSSNKLSVLWSDFKTSEGMKKILNERQKRMKKNDSEIPFTNGDYR